MHTTENQPRSSHVPPPPDTGEESLRLELAHLKAERDRLAELLASVPGVVWEAYGEPDRPNQRIAYVSPTVESLLGYPVEQWLSTPNFWLKVVHPDDRDAAAAAAAALFAGAKPGTIQFRWLASDGREVWAESACTIVRDESGRPIGMRCVTTDVTARKMSEDAAARLAAIVESSEDAIIGKTLGGIITDWNAGAERTFGYAAPEAVGRHVSMLVPPERLGEEDSILARLRVGERIPPFETIRVRKDGVRIDVSQTTSPIRAPGGAVIGAATISRDITARKQAEHALRQRTLELTRTADALKRSNEELDQFAYVTSHDLKAPLRGIANLSGWIEEDMGPAFTPEAHQQMELLRGRVHRMEALIDGILEYSRVGRAKGKAERVDVGQLLREVIDLISPPAGVVVTVAPDMPAVVTERLRLQQVFMNLIGNAIKHHDRPAQARIEVLWRDGGDLFEFAVADNGPGIDPKYHEKIFVIFQTLAARDKVEGTGVGLSLVKKIVQSQGGTVTVESSPGRGATFRFTWPKAPKG
jgi:PAS domain S-box-containing protein